MQALLPAFGTLSLLEEKQPLALGLGFVSLSPALVGGTEIFLNKNRRNLPLFCHVVSEMATSCDE